MSRGADALVVGGGLIGCAIAAELAARGLEVVVVERGEPGCEASGAAAGMLSPQADASEPSPLFDLALEGRQLYPEWSRVLRDETGIDVGYRQTGLLRCPVGGEPGSGGASAAAGWQRARGLRVEEYPRSALPPGVAERLGPEVAAAVFFPDEAVVNPRALTRAAWLSAERRGVRVITGTSVRRLLLERGVCRGVDTDAGPMEARTVIDAAGAWAAALESLPVAVPVEPVRGQIVEIRLAGRPLETVVSSEDVYVVPRPDGTALLGSTMERVGFRKEVTAGAVARILEGAQRLLPEIGSARFVSAWAGLRPATPDGWPLLGASSIEGLVFATGHFRSGILLAPSTARHIGELLTGRPSERLSPFSVERFAGLPSRA